MTAALDGQRLKKDLAFVCRGYRSNPTCVITRVSRQGQVTYFRESDPRQKPVTVDVEEFKAKFGGWTESALLRARRWRAERDRQLLIDAHHEAATVDNLLFDAARVLNVGEDQLQQILLALDPYLDHIRQDAYRQGSSEALQD